MYRIREATAGDYNAFVPLYRESRKGRKENEASSELDPEMYKKIIADPAVKLYFVEKEKELHAFTLFYPKKPIFFLRSAGKGVLYIEELYVKSSEERKGIDQHLFQKIEKYGSQMGIDTVEIALPVTQEKKIAYYKERLRLSPVDVVLTRDL